MFTLYFLQSEITVAVEELDDSPQESWQDGRFTATRRFVCAWADRRTLTRELLGGYAFRSVTYPGVSAAPVRSVNVRPFHRRVQTPMSDPNTEVNGYERALVEVVYGTDNEDPQAETTERFEPSAEFIGLKTQGLRWGAPDGPALEPTEAPGKLVVLTDWVYRVRRLSRLPEAITDLVGRVNEAAVYSQALDRNFEAGTLLYNAYSIEQENYPEGPSTRSVEMRFTYKPQGWNRFWRGDLQGGAWAEVFTEQGHPLRAYPSGNFAELPLKT
jgi:hypothetical protein